jgi:geranylgeranyl diphosphate synthase, type I
MPVQGPPEVLRRLAAEIDLRLDDALGRMLPRLTDVHPSLTAVAEELRAFVGGGKRIRPVLLLLGFEAAGGHTRQDVHGPALALELLHTCALAHDDVIDRAPERRGRPSIHHGFAAQHRAADWSGDALGYGEAVAILVGDLAFVQADELFLSAHVPDRQLLAALRRFTVLREEVMVGQYLDLQAATSRTTDRDLALTVATLKSGRYSVARPLEIGAELAGADESFLDGLRAFGDPLGRAFQVQDDLLGVFGEQQTTGKSASSDLVEGKRTLLVAEATARLGAADRAVLEAGLGDPGLSAERAAELRELMVRCGARDAVQHHVRDAVAQARSALEDLPLAPRAHDHLDAVATYLGDRAS